MYPDRYICRVALLVKGQNDETRQEWAQNTVSLTRSHWARWGKCKKGAQTLHSEANFSFWPSVTEDSWRKAIATVQVRDSTSHGNCVLCLPSTWQFWEFIFTPWLLLIFSLPYLIRVFIAHYCDLHLTGHWVKAAQIQTCWMFREVLTKKGHAVALC